MTHKYLTIPVGFTEKTVNIRMAQYESGLIWPKADLTNTLSKDFKSHCRLYYTWYRQL